MAADGERRDSRAESKQEKRSNHGGHRDVLKDCVGSIIESLAELGAKVCANRRFKIGLGRRGCVCTFNVA